MAVQGYEDMDATDLARLVRRREVSPAELVETAIARAEALNPALNAIVLETFDRARKAAGAMGEPSGPFAGVPFLMKDILGFEAGLPTRQGSAFLPGAPMDHDATLTLRFRAAGLISLGKTNVPEFGLISTTESRLYGPARNPWNTEHSAGGSSGGAGAAVAARIVPMAHANDGGGSIRIPASCNGLVGLKPTRGRVPLGPDLGDIMGGLVADFAVTRSVRDTAALLDAVAFPEPGDPYGALPPPGRYTDEPGRDPGRLRIAFARTALGGRRLHPDAEAAVSNAAALCARLGHHVEEVSPDLDMHFLQGVFMPIWTSGLAALIDSTALLTGRTPQRDDFEGLTWGLYQTGRAVSAAQYQMCWTLIQRAARAVAAFHHTWDVWLTPTLGAPPPKLGSVDIEETDVEKAFAPIIDYVPFTAIQNATGQPAISLPLHWTADGLPKGVQAVGRMNEEHLLIRLAAQLEAEAPWAARKPAILTTA